MASSTSMLVIAICNSLLATFIMSVRLYVGNLSFDATAEDLREIFSQTGTVEDAVIVTRPGGGRPRGFGFVTLANEAEGAEAIRQLNGQAVSGRALKVNVAKSREESNISRDCSDAEPAVEAESAVEAEPESKA
jgi:RNA recognition motif-containing protein